MFTETQKPEITLFVMGTPIRFLCDTGACRTTINSLAAHVKLSQNCTIVRAAHGGLKRVQETDPVWIRDPEGKSCQMSILLIPDCPVNLLGRDGLVQLQLTLAPTPTGMAIIRQKPSSVYVVQGRESPNYYYTLNVPNKEPTRTGDQLVQEGLQAIVRKEDVMSPDELHVTMWYARTIEPEYEEQLRKLTPAKIQVTYVYSDEVSTSAAAVTLTEPLKRLFRGLTSPHISLTKTREEKWEDLGRIVYEGNRAHDWTQTGVNTWYSASTGLTKKSLFWTTSVNAGVHLDDKTE